MVVCIGIGLVGIVPLLLAAAYITFIKVCSESNASFFHESTPSFVVPLVVKDYNVIGRISVGKPKAGETVQVFNIDLNTNSAESWIYSAALCEKRDCTKEPFHGYDGLKSETYKRTNTEVHTTLSSSTPVTWPAVKDQFKFGSGGDAAVVTLEFMEITNNPYEYQGYDGTLGLSLMENVYTVNEAAVLAFYQQMKEAVFGFYFRKVPKGNDHGSFIMGGRDANFITGPFNSHSVLTGRGGSLQGWFISIEKIVLIFRDGSRKEQPLSVNVAGPAPMVRDVFLPVADSSALVENMFQGANIARDPNNRRMFPCDSSFKDLPDVALVMNGKDYILTPEEYVRQTSSGQGCVVAIGNYQHNVVLGRVFMKKYYTRFHVAKKEIQFALAKHKR